MEKIKQIWSEMNPPIQAQVAWQVGGIWIFNILIALDQLLNTIFWGDPDETISSRAAKARLEGACWGCFLCKMLDLIDKKHCEDALEHDEGKNSVMAIYKRNQEGAS